MKEKGGKLAAHCEIVGPSPFASDDYARDIGFVGDEACANGEVHVGGRGVVLYHMLPHNIQIFEHHGVFDILLKDGQLLDRMLDHDHMIVQFDGPIGPLIPTPYHEFSVGARIADAVQDSEIHIVIKVFFSYHCGRAYEVVTSRSSASCSGDMGRWFLLLLCGFQVLFPFL